MLPYSLCVPTQKSQGKIISRLSWSQKRGTLHPRVFYSLGPFGVKTMPSILSCCLLVAFLSFQSTNLSYIGIPFHCIHYHLSVFVGLQLAYILNNLVSQYLMRYVLLKTFYVGFGFSLV